MDTEYKVGEMNSTVWPHSRYKPVALLPPYEPDQSARRFRFFNATRWRIKVAYMIRQWKQSRRFLLVSLALVFIIELIVHGGERSFMSSGPVYSEWRDYEMSLQVNAGPAAGRVGFIHRAHYNRNQYVRPRQLNIQESSNIQVNNTPKELKLTTKTRETEQQRSKPSPESSRTMKVNRVIPEISSHKWRNTSVSFEERVDDLVSRLTMDEIISQTIATYSKATVGIPRLGIKPFVWISECLSGQTSTQGTAFPQALTLAASFSPDTFSKVGEAISVEVRGHWNDNIRHNKYHTFFGLNCLGPNLDLMRHPLWGRNQETYGEDAVLTSLYASKYVSGMQGRDRKYVRVSASCKYLAAHGGPEKGRGNIDAKVNTSFMIMPITNSEYESSFLPPFRACTKAGALGMVCSRHKVDGVPFCANKALLTDTLRTDWGFSGFVVSDSRALEGMLTAQNYSQSEAEVASRAIKAGTNLEIASSTQAVYRHQREALRTGRLTEAEVRRNVKPLLLARMRLGEFDPPGRNPYYGLDTSAVQSGPHRNLALQTAVMSLVLLKNDNKLLPLNPAKKIKRIAVIGPYANDSHSMYGTLAPNMNAEYASSPLQGLFGLAEKVIFTPGCLTKECLELNVEAIENATQDINMAFVCLGTHNEVPGKDRTSLSLHGKQLRLLQLATRGNSKFPVVLLLFNGGPVDISWAKTSPRVSSIIECGFPGQSAGKAIYNLLTRTGAHSSPAGRLPATWPSLQRTILTVKDSNPELWTYRYLKGGVLYPFGYGLSYTTFHYKNLNLSSTTADKEKAFRVSVELCNTGQITADEVVQAYICWRTPPRQGPFLQLAAVRRVSTKPTSCSHIDLHIKPEIFNIWLLPHTKHTQLIHKGEMKVFVGGQQPNQQTKVPSNVLVADFTLR